MGRVADRRGLDPESCEGGLGGPPDSHDPCAPDFFQETFQDVQVGEEEAALGGPVRERAGRSGGVPWERVPEENAANAANTVRRAADRIPDDAPRGLQPEGGVAAGRPERRVGGPGKPPLRRTRELPLASERDPGKPSSAEPDRLAQEDEPGAPDPFQVSLQVPPPLPRRPGLVELGVFVAIGIADARAGTGGSAVELAQEGGGGQL